MISACFSDSKTAINVFNSELAIASAKGCTVKKSWEIALKRASEVLGEDELFVYRELPNENKSFSGFIYVNGVKKECTVYHKENGFPTVV